MPALLRNTDLAQIDGAPDGFGFYAGAYNPSPVWFGATETALGSFEILERLSTFAFRAHALTCCPCGEDHSAELLAHKISLTGGVFDSGASQVVLGAQDPWAGVTESATAVIGGEVAGNTSTAYSITIGDSVVSQIEISGDQDWYRVQLQAGVTYEFRLTGTGGDILDDPFLELMDASGAMVKENDDGAGNYNSLLRYTPSASGTFYLNAHGWVDPDDDTTSTGTYTLSTGLAPAIPTWTLEQVAAYLVNGSNSGLGPRWQQTNVTYNIQDLSLAEQALAQRALDMWAAITPLNFIQTTGNANLTFVNAVVDDPNHDPDDAGTQAAYARTSTSGSSITSSTIVVTSGWSISAGGQAFDSYQQQTYIHEIGHALGLGHPGPYDGSAEYGTDNLYTNDHWAYTVMSYFDQLEAGHGNYRYVLGLQQADIVAVQMLYGANPAGTFAGNTTFGFNSSAPGTNIDWSQFVLVQPEGTYRRPPSMTLYDTGGIDTINLSGFSQPQIVDLRPGSFSSIGDRPDPAIPHYVNVISIASNTIIENAVGGSGNDTITGNSAANTISGLSGNNNINGLGGNDILSALSGNDTLDGGDGIILSGPASQIYRLYVGTLDREPDVSSHRSWVSILDGGSQSLTQVAASFVNSAEFQAQYGALNNTQFVTQLYSNVLDRAPDPSGLNSWVSQLNSGTSREQVVVGFTESAEFTGRSSIPSQAYAAYTYYGDVESQVFRLYEATLGRAPDPIGFASWVNSIVTDQASYAGVIPGFVNSLEFQQTYGSLNNSQFVTLLYNNVLNRAPDPIGLNDWVSQLNSGTSRTAVVQGFAESAEFVSSSRQDFINFMRTADLGWQDTLSAGSGNDILFGGRGSDSFAFGAGDTGGKTIYGFQAYDYVNLSGFGSVGQFTSALSQSGGDVVYTAGGLTIRFVGASLADVANAARLAPAAEEIGDDTQPMIFADAAGSSLSLAESPPTPDDSFDFTQQATAPEHSEARLANVASMEWPDMFSFSQTRLTIEDTPSFQTITRLQPTHHEPALHDALDLLDAGFDFASISPQQIDMDWT